jgi:Serine/threonine protein kinase
MDKETIILDKRYELIKQLGEGGMGKVYLCKDNRLDILVAVKEFKSGKALNFVSEPHILKMLKHSGIPQIYDIFEENESVYMVEEYIEGITLEEYTKKSEIIPIQGIIRIAMEICDIMAYLHSFNPPIIYRDLKTFKYNNKGRWKHRHNRFWYFQSIQGH